jgi:hypothetical protein
MRRRTSPDLALVSCPIVGIRWNVDEFVEGLVTDVEIQ